MNSKDDMYFLSAESTVSPGSLGWPECDVELHLSKIGGRIIDGVWKPTCKDALTHKAFYTVSSKEYCTILYRTVQNTL